MSGSLWRGVAKRCSNHHRQRQQSPAIWSATRTAPPSPSSHHQPTTVSQLCSPRSRFHYIFHRFRESAISSSFSLPLSPPAWKSQKGIVSWYLSMIEAHPVITKSITASAIFAAADVSSQMITGTSSDSFDLVRTLRMAGYGMLILGPTLHLWFNFISRIWPKQDVISTLKKIFIGQTVFGPVMTTIFFSTNAVLQGEDGGEIIARLKRDLYPALRNGLVYWPMADFITFKFVAVRLQPVICNTFSFFWTIYLTQMASLKKADLDTSTQKSSSGQSVNSLQISERKPIQDEKAWIF